MANSNSFLSPYEVLTIAQENKYIITTGAEVFASSSTLTI